MLEVVNHTIQEMPDRMREIFLLNRNEQKTIVEISEKLDISPKTARKQLDRAMSRLRRSTQSYKTSVMELLFIAWLISNALCIEKHQKMNYEDNPQEHES